MLLILCSCFPTNTKVYKYSKGDVVQLKTGEPCIIIRRLQQWDYEIRVTAGLKGSTEIWVYEYELQDSK